MCPVEGTNGFGYDPIFWVAEKNGADAGYWEFMLVVIAEKDMDLARESLGNTFLIP